MGESTQGDQNGWVVADLSPEERKSELRSLADDTPIVRYVRLSTLFLYLSGRAFIPSWNICGPWKMALQKCSVFRKREAFEGIVTFGRLLHRA